MVKMIITIIIIIVVSCDDNYYDGNELFASEILNDNHVSFSGI